MTGSVSGVRRTMAASIRPGRAMSGTAAVGLAAAVLFTAGRFWLPLLVGVLALLHQAQAYRVRAGAQRRTWAALADVTRALSQPDERAVATACLRGAAVLFAPDEIEITLNHPGGVSRIYQARANDLGHPRQGLAQPTRVWLTRALRVGTTDIGQLRLRRAGWTARADQHAFSTFAGAAASAFHDAATQQRLRALAARSAYDAVHDPLTGLINRSTLLARATAQLRRVDPYSPVALVVLDLDGLRAVNDTLGHASGDQLLAALARRLADHLDPAETVGRLGDDEFAILMVGDPAAAGPPGRPCTWSHPVERTRSVVAELAVPIEVDRVTVSVEASAGLVIERAGCVDMTELLRRADVALHQARGSGARVVAYEPGSDRFSADRLALLADLRDALAGTDQLTICLQPTVDLVTGAPVGAEALARWRHPRLGLLRPAEFLGAVEHSELSAAFTRHMLDQALDIASGWVTQGLRLPVSVNVGARCTLDPELAATVSGRLASRAVAPQRLTVEITETVMADQLDVVAGVITSLRGQGVRVCVDDFGTGSASLSFLTTFCVDEVKIARSFVAAMLQSPQAAAIVRATVDIARELGLRVVAKGVERVEQRDALLDLGVRQAQGFLFHTPMEVTEATAAMQARAHRATAASIPLVRAHASPGGEMGDPGAPRDGRERLGV